MADPVAELENEGKPGGEPVGGESEKKPETKPDASNTDILNALKDVKDALTKPGQPAPTPAEIRAALKEKTGFSDAQLDVVQQLSIATSSHSDKKVAELEAKVAWNEFKDDIGGKIDTAVEKIMRDELNQYEPRYRGDKELLKKIHYMAIGIQADKAAKARRADPNNNDKPNDANNIAGRTIVNDTPGSAANLDNEGKSKNGQGQLSEEEKTMAKKMNVSEEDYQKAKSTKIVSQLKGSIK